MGPCIIIIPRCARGFWSISCDDCRKMGKLATISNCKEREREKEMLWRDSSAPISQTRQNFVWFKCQEHTRTNKKGEGASEIKHSTKHMLLYIKIQIALKCYGYSRNKFYPKVFMLGVMLIVNLLKSEKCLYGVSFYVLLAMFRVQWSFVFMYFNS